MKALIYERYGPPEVVRVEDVPKPSPGPGEVLIRVHASAVNTADWRMRAAAFPGILAIPGRLIYGLWRPRNRRLGTEFAGTIEAIGQKVERFRAGEAVYGIKPSGGASAEYIAVAEESALAPVPTGLTFEDAAALPFGGIAALVFLVDFGQLKAGQRVLIVGGSGGVGCYAIQIAKALGTHVAAVAGPDSQAFMRGLGADITIDYTKTRLSDVSDDFDLILDTVGVLSPKVSRRLLSARGLFLPLNFGLREIGAALLNPIRTRKIRLAVNDDKPEHLLRLNAMIESGGVRPVIDASYPLEKAADAHVQVEMRHRKGAIVLVLS